MANIKTGQARLKELLNQTEEEAFWDIGIGVEQMEEDTKLLQQAYKTVVN